MSLNLVVFVLRIGSAALLYLFLIGAIFVMWRDWRAVARQVEDRRTVSRRTFGQLVVVQAGKSDLVQGDAFPISVVTRLGRAATNSVVIEDAFASAEHARLSFRNGRWWLEDLNSRNGTLLNQDRLNAPAIVAGGDVIGIGEVKLRIDLANRQTSDTTDQLIN
ncbi:MAG: FHA domain-containing protein [Anaerolineae bacterium]|nr:FHA domain-containing protein [Anaerolineae bacterium]